MDALLRPAPQPAGVPRRRPVHPGRFLERQVLQPMGISQSEAARRLGISRRRVNELVLGHRAMSPDTAIRCALAFGLPAAHWLALQSDWDCWHAWQGLRRQWQRLARREGSNLPAAVATAGASVP